MILIVGLGNPGFKYKKTRHNVGFLALNYLQKENSFSKFKFSKKFKADVSEGEFLGERVFLAKPQTFMNSSGQSVKLLTNFYKLDLQNLTVIHDDIDILLGKFKVSENSSSAGHNGVKSIIQELGTQDFTRIRIGIQPLTPLEMEIKDFVLAKFAKQEKIIIEQAIKKAVTKVVASIG